MEGYFIFMNRETPYCQVVIYSKLTYRFYTFPIKIPASYCVAAIKPILKFIWKAKDPE